MPDAPTTVDTTFFQISAPVRGVNANIDVVNPVRVDHGVPYAWLQLNPFVVKLSDGIPSENDACHDVFSTRIQRIFPDVDALPIAREAAGINLIPLDRNVCAAAMDIGALRA